MFKKIFSIGLSMFLIFSMLNTTSYAEELSKTTTPVSVGVVEKDLATNVVKKLTYSRDINNKNIIQEEDSWVDTNSTIETLGTISASTLLSTRSILGNDGRTLVNNTEQFPYSAIAHLEIHFGTTTVRGTGFFIADNIVATAAHCIYDEELGWATLITVRPARNGLLSIPYGLATAKRLAVSTQWLESNDSNYDWGAFSIPSGIIGNPGFFNVTAIAQNSTIQNAKISGYPAYIGSSTTQIYKQYEMNGDISTFGEFKLSYTIDTSGGQSGAPILNYNNEVVGIHTSGGNILNYGVRATDSMVYYFNEFITNYS